MSNRPADPPRITQSNMRPGDIILSRSAKSDDWRATLLDDLILALDQGDYTHAAIWDGEYVIEALLDGVHIDDKLELTFQNQELIDVYRAEYSGHVVGAPDWPAAPVLDAARTFKGYSYGYTKLVLAALVLLTSEVPKNPIIETALRIFSSAALAELEKFLKQEHSMICSEVVAQGYYDALADPNHKYGLPIVVDDHHHISIDPKQHATMVNMAESTSDQKLQEFHQLRKRLSEIYPAKTVESLGMLAKRESPITVIGGSAELSAAFVTPGDLQRCPALKLVGTLKQPAT